MIKTILSGYYSNFCNYSITEPGLHITTYWDFWDNVEFTKIVSIRNMKFQDTEKKKKTTTQKQRQMKVVTQTLLDAKIRFLL